MELCNLFGIDPNKVEELTIVITATSLDVRAKMDPYSDNLGIGAVFRKYKYLCQEPFMMTEEEGLAWGERARQAELKHQQERQDEGQH